MKPTISNAFLRGWNSRSRATTRSKPAIATLTASIRGTEYGWSLSLSPMRAIDTVPTWVGTGASRSAATLLFGVQQSEWRENRHNLPIAGIAARLGVPLIDVIDPGCIIVADDDLEQLIGPLDTTQLSAVRVEGPIEPSDAAAIRSAVRAGRSPLLAELRAVAAIGVIDDRHVTLHSRELAAPVGLIGETLRHFLAALLNRNVNQISSPPIWQIERLLGVSGTIRVRPIEATLNGSSLDIGISTSPEKEPAPASRSLIYDLPSSSWHDDP